ncbi:MAG: cofactor-independent phosphoglycerate mutase [Clostridia bacterium]|nr:cofactor-independent phosphoglycerate mutase [Clostridia bacterium]
MKYIVILGDGMADTPVEALGGKTPLEVAKKPVMDKLASMGEMGMVKTVPDGTSPGSDVANLSVLGYNPLEVYTGRSPLEAVSIGVALSDTDVTYRVNTVTLSDEEAYEDKTMVDYSSDEITSAEGAQLMQAMNEAFANERIHFYAGTSYRNLMVEHKGKTGCTLTPPHDISSRVIGAHLPKGADYLLDMMKKSYDILKNHPVNLDRVKRGLHPANSIWFWGEGTKPGVTNFKEKYGVDGAMISAVDLLKGIGYSAGMEVIEVEGATGNVDTNFEGKAKAVCDALLGGKNFAYLHVEAADECGHRGEMDNKVLSIEKLDAALGSIIECMEKAGESYSILLMPDHPTPLATRTHASDAVPYVIYRSDAPKEKGNLRYTEKDAQSTGIYEPVGYKLMDKFLN